MKDFIKNFFKRGLIAFGFGPIIMAIVYICLHLAGVDDTLGFVELAKQILLVSLMAFVVGGITSIYQVERLPLPYAILIQATVLYVDYIVVYLVNGWLQNALVPIIVFTAIFIVAFAVIWLIVYVLTKRAERRLNERLKNEKQ